MTTEEYKYLASLPANTANDIKELLDLIYQQWEIDLYNAVRGITTESNEIADMLKRRFVYRKQIDQIHVKEYLVDLLWYISLTIKSLGYTFEEIMELNINKLKVRYPNLYNQTDALNRNLDEERKSLEKS